MLSRDIPVGGLLARVGPSLDAVAGNAGDGSDGLEAAKSFDDVASGGHVIAIMTKSHRFVNDSVEPRYDKSAIAPTLPDTVSVLRMDGAQTLSSMSPGWLKAELTKDGRSQSALARYMGLAPEQVNRIVQGKRQIKAAEADQIRAYLAQTGPGGAAIPHISPQLKPASLLTVRGTVEAGSWREVAISDDVMHEAETLPAPQSIVDSGAYALRVSGPSMNQRYPDGSYVVVQPWHGGPLPIGKRVIVEREAPDGKVETTVKELVRGRNGELELWPRSTHPAHQAPIRLEDEKSAILVRVIGTVIWAIQPD